MAYARRLPEKVATFIVCQLACHRSPTEVVADVAERFPSLELKLTKQKVEYYDPTKRAQKGNLAKKWRVLFHETRKRWLESTADVPIANRRYRLEQLQHLYQRALDQGRGNLPLAKELLEHAAKEVGDTFTNRRLIEVDPRGALQKLLGLSDEQMDELEGAGL